MQNYNNVEFQNTFSMPKLLIEKYERTVKENNGEVTYIYR